MKKFNRKGFTIVELVIVIAVIAILSAVLIPTFSSLIRKANISSDTVLCKNLNTALNIAEVENKIEDFDDVIDAIKEHGYLIANLNAKTNGCFFVWEEETNQILLVDGNDGYKVLFSIKEGYGDPDESWYFAISSELVAKKVKTDLNSVEIKKTVDSIKNLTEILNSGQDEVVYIDESVVLTSENTIKVESGKEITIKLGASSLATNGSITGIPVEAINGTLIVEGGYIGAAGEFENVNGTFSTAVGFEGTSKLVLNNVNVNGKGNAVAGANQTDGPAQVEINDSTLSSTNVGFQLATWGTGVLNNVNINCPNPIFASYGAKIEINGGDYKSTTDCLIEMHDNTSYAPAGTGPTTVTINSGKFTFQNELFLFSGAGKIIVNGGTFNGVDYLEYFENGETYGGGVASIDGTTVTITK